MSSPQNPGADPAGVADRCGEHGDLCPYSAPPGLLTPRPIWLAPSLLLSFVAAALGIHLVLQRLTFLYGGLVSELAGVHRFELPKQASIAVRPLTVALLMLFSLFAAGTLRARLRLGTTALAIYLPLMITIDVLFARWARHGGPSPFMARGNIFDGVIGILAACLAVLSVARLPASLRLESVVRRPKYYMVVFLVSIAATVASVMAIFHFVSRRLHSFSTFPLLGGLFSVVVFFFALFPMYLCILGYLSERLRAGHGTKTPEIGAMRDISRLTFGFLIPAHNEERCIGDCIRAIDMAAGGCTRLTTIYVVENGSSDDTYEKANRALAECRHARGVLLTSSTQYKSHAKAHALNTGLCAATEQIIVRVDADTFVSETLLQRLAPYFLKPNVGGVGTIPLPHKVTTWIERMRSLEVYYGAGFKRTSQGAVDAIPVLPGAAVAFRRDLLTRIGGFSEGIRGEDADVTVRVGRLGYRIVSDPMIKVLSEQPQNFRELREQRMRWSSGLFHMIGRNRSAIYRIQGLRGIWTLPWACFVMFRKLMLIPFAVAAIGEVVLSHSFLPVREIAAAGAIVLGAQLAVMGLVVTVLGGPVLVFSLPSYMVFRLIVTYFSLETLLTVRLKEQRWRLPISLALPRRALGEPSDAHPSAWRSGSDGDAERARDPREEPEQTAEPSWRMVLAGTIGLRLERWGLRGRAAADAAPRPAWRVFALLGLVLVVFTAAGALTVVVVRHTTAGPTSNNAAGPGSRSLGATAEAARSDTAGWVVRQVSRAAIVACDPVMCSALVARGFPAGSLLVLGSSAANPLDSAVVIATPAVRSQFDSRLTNEYAPIAIASFGSGTARVDVLVTAADGAVAYRNALYGDLRGRQEAGAQLLHNARITCSPQARAALAAGQVDVRLLITFAALAALDQLNVLAFGGGGPGASAGVPLRTAEVASPAGGPGFVRSALALLRAQRAPYLASSIRTVRLASGITALRIGYSAPSPLGLLGGQATAAHAKPSGH